MQQLRSIQIVFGLFLLFLTGSITLALGLQSIQNDSLTMDELAHTPAAYSYIVEQDYRLNPEHPPLLKVFAGGGVWLGSQFTNTDIVPPSASEHWQGPNNQWDVGVDFFYNLGNDPRFLMFWSRLPMMMLYLVGAFYIFYAVIHHTKSPALATISGVGFLTSVNVLAHARYVTTDVGITLALVVVLDWFSRYLKSPNIKNTIGLIIAFILAAFVKFSWVVVGPVFLILFIYYRKVQDQKTWVEITKEGLLKSLLLGIFLFFSIQIAYSFLIINMSLDLQVELINTSFPSDNTISQVTRDGLSALAQTPGMRPFAHFVTGQLMVFQRVGGGNIVYLLGMIKDSSFRIYFPITYLLKTPIPFLILGFMALLTFVRGTKGKLQSFWKSVPVFYQVTLIFILWYWLVAISSNLNLGIRYILPIVVATEIVVWYVVFENLPNLPGWKTIRNISYIWFILTPLIAFPSYLGYVNDFVGRERAFQVFVDSNVDWGQDLYRLVDFTEENNIDTIKLDYFGGGNPNAEFPGKFENLDSREGPQTGWVAVSATKLQNSRYYQQEFDIEDYWWLYWEKPEAVIGGSILVYYVEPQHEDK